MRNALIINGSGFIPCSQRCNSLISLLQGAHVFDRVLETSIESARAEPNLVFDLILPRFLFRDWARHGMQFCKQTWVSTRTFAVLCDRERKSRERIPPALIDVDDFVFCPYEENEFLLRIKRLLKKERSAGNSTIARPAGSPRELDLLVGESETFLQAVAKVGLMAQSKAPVVISGETGSGKELLARAIHYQSVRKAKPFIPVNCGALPDELFENELFGHLKGAYTGALTAVRGLVAEAEGGTLFLDEVDALSPAAQIKLLRFLQSGEFRPLGSSRSMVADVRIIAATNTDLSRCVELKLFREDLHYRLNVLSLEIPPLRDRGSDILTLASHFLSVYAREHDRLAPRLSDEAMKRLLNYSWPGNVRELESVIQRAIVLQDSQVLTAEDLGLPRSNDRTGSQSELFRLGKSMAIGRFERNFLADLLATHGGNISHAARAAGKDRRSFQRLISKYALDRKSFKT
ncbi:MAG TPA: sigma-54 dependent transcriptional regulator [Pyrinomonadaceae bacterium]